MIGRKREQQLLERTFRAKEAQLIAIYGRRRVGKTWLIREFFARKKCRLMQATGMQKGTRQQQLANFIEAVAASFAPGATLETPKTWMDAFKQLTSFLENAPRREKIVVFLDEFPWMATRKSNLLEATAYYWNQHWSRLPHVILVICGSSASWLIKNIIYNKGGLHNRVTCDIRLEPFTLAETEEFLASRKIKLTRRQILCLYMALGGIPYYLNYVEAGSSADQNIQQIFFARNAPLRSEFDKLFSSLFIDADAYVELIRLIGGKQEGATRAQLKAAVKLSQTGGQLSERLKDLRDAGFIQIMPPWQGNRGEYYRLADEFSLFYLRWIDPVKAQRLDRNYWTSQADKPAFATWAGYAFENICLGHIDPILSALRIPAGGIVGSWRFIPRRRGADGAQIDLLIDRTDDAITVCEMKYTAAAFRIDKHYAKALMKKVEVFKARTHTRKQVFIAMICANGLQESIYSEELICAYITAEDLFGA